MTDMITTTEAKLMSHEAVCAERYKGISDTLDKNSLRMTKLEYLIYVVLAVVLLGPGVGAEFFKKLLGI
jgi:hypothetical protein